MTPAELKAARRTLGLTAKQMAAMLDITPEWLFSIESSAPSGSPPGARHVRLMKAYLAGYRPDDWPGGKE